jgi:hypothetical protein
VRVHLKALQEQLTTVEASIVQAELNITRQRQHIRNREAGGRDSELSRSVLHNLGNSLALHRWWRMHLLGEMEGR